MPTLPLLAMKTPLLAVVLATKLASSPVVVVPRLATYSRPLLLLSIELVEVILSIDPVVSPLAVKVMSPVPVAVLVAVDQAHDWVKAELSNEPLAIAADRKLVDIPDTPVEPIVDQSL